VVEEPAPTPRRGNLSIVATAPDYAQAFLAQTAKRARLDTNAWFAVPVLPHSATNLPAGALEVALEAEGFKVDAATSRVLIEPDRTTEVSTD